MAELWRPARRQFLSAAAALVGVSGLVAACGGKAGGNGAGASTSSSVALGMSGQTITIRKAPGPVTLTGVYDASWKGIPALTLAADDPAVTSTGVVTPTPNFSSQVYLQYDATYFYALEVRTQDPPFQQTGGDGKYYLGDTIMFFFDTDSDKTGSAYIEGDYALFITPFDGTKTSPLAWDREGHTGGANEHQITDCKLACKTNAGGYVFAIAVPWTELQVTAPWDVKSGAQVGFSLAGASQTSDGTWGQIQLDGQADDQSTWGTLQLA